MERKIGEVFEFNGKKYQVVEVGSGCEGCAFDYCLDCSEVEIKGKCHWLTRKDKEDVIFVEVE